MVLTLITFLIVLSILVFVHELGHFMVARRFGVRAEEFGWGFPPRLWGIYKNQEGRWKNVWGGRKVDDALGTIYSINWFPLGGFVKIKGENGPSAGSGQVEDADSFAIQKIWKRAAILSAGVSMNVVLAAMLITIGLLIGMPQALDGVNPSAEVTDRKIQIIQVMPDTPAAAVGLRVGDIIESINDVKFANYQDLQKFVDEHTGEEIYYRLKRSTEEFIAPITPTLMEETGKGGIGIAIAETGIVKYSLFLAVWEGIKTTAVTTWVIIVAFYNLLKGLVLGQGLAGAELAGPVGIAVLTGQVARLGLVYILQFTAILSINLAIINFFPFPALDGGRVLFLAIEKIKGTPVKREVEAFIHNVGFALLMLLVLVVTFQDVAKFGDKFKMIWDKIF
ncbi:RIP metalloprotease RseP [Candidatus Falkowbacteria bacterium]|nr:RIP metalloprotease RseP [Candidatus Falkowbacteria bacterium]